MNALYTLAALAVVFVLIYIFWLGPEQREDVRIVLGAIGLHVKALVSAVWQHFFPKKT